MKIDLKEILEKEITIFSKKEWDKLQLIFSEIDNIEVYTDLQLLNLLILKDLNRNSNLAKEMAESMCKMALAPGISYGIQKMNERETLVINNSMFGRKNE